MKKLSVIIPCYNEAKSLPLLISRCEKVVALEKDIEFIIVDNGSTDDTQVVIKELTSKLSFIKTVIVKVNKGYGYGILSGLQVAKGEILSWTHADLQTDPVDLLNGFNFFKSNANMELLFVKGKRYGRPFLDIIFTIGMSIFETLLLRKYMWDINAQPTMFHRNFFLTWNSPPYDFSLDLFVYYMAKKENLEIKRFPVLFGDRAYGVSHWNINFSSKYNFIKRTLLYSLKLHNRLK
jgi:glycosyltransferase involved in cell wall biosynthesis|tara:strand:- start:848 stop:1555 length:708 start_codon:yes stop_codon:yes gene_type:complete